MTPTKPEHPSTSAARQPADVQTQARRAPAVSVIMNCLNSRRFLKEAIDSVYAQTFTDWEIIFWDNASIDGSSDIAQSYDDRIVYCRGEHTIPLGAARNKAIERASGRYIAFLDCDDLWMPTKLEKQIPLFERDQQVGIVFSDTLFFSAFTRPKRLYRSRKPPRGQVHRELLRSYFLSLETVVLRREALDQLDHWFDPRFNLIEEADLFRRVSFSWKLDYVDEPLAKYRIHDGAWSFNRQDLWPRETELMIAKYIASIDGFEATHAEELRAMSSAVAYHDALERWSNDDGPGARALLRDHLARGGKFATVYALSFLPFRFFRRLLMLKRRHAGLNH